MAPASSAKFAAAIVAVAVVVGLAAFAAGRLTSPVESFPVEGSAAAGFARDMQVHHAQGVELATIIRSETDDDEIRLLAYDIETSQQQQSGQMYGWLDMWGLPQRGSEPPMTWMSKPAIGDGDGHVMSGDVAAPSTMPGYATHEQVAHLKTLTGTEAEKEFLRLMIVHHEGAIEMAQSALDRTDTRVVVQLATATIATQGAEITYMRSLLAARD
jgi:uncharacterized protein (DUF305 family)